MCFPFNGSVPSQRLISVVLQLLCLCDQIVCLIQSGQNIDRIVDGFRARIQDPDCRILRGLSGKRNIPEVRLQIIVDLLLVILVDCDAECRDPCRRSRNPCDRRICGDEAQHLADSGLRPVHVGELEGGDSRCDCSECCLDELRVSRCEVKNRSDGLGESGCNASQAFQDARNHRSELAHQVSDTFEEFHDRRPDAFCIIGDVLRDGVYSSCERFAGAGLDILKLRLQDVCPVLQRVRHLAICSIGRACGILHGRDVLRKQLCMRPGQGQDRIAGFDRRKELVDADSGRIRFLLHDLEGIGQIVPGCNEVSEAGPGQFFELLTCVRPGIGQFDDCLPQLSGCD